ncbi:TRAP transporter substrate-binding protein DctP [Bacillus sp. V3B]|uniref:TRAP transporter substrate-binding protein n=1 Tax=Bacillus sp. V3B TaxID=2804915 RepID=UPI00210AFE71|nr:TRAP transporter substrate-binding protein DctP [Bacillus sp. V3B]MCQ6275362.1 TRAP transporter substrate-binding protein DctP [Bacillus sp. V3B]
MKNKKRTMLVSILLVLGVFLAACGNQQSFTEGNEENKSPSDSSEPIVLVMGDHLPAGHYMGGITESFQERVVELSDSKVKFEYYSAGQLGGITEMAQLIKDGAVDLGWSHVPSAGFLPKTSVTLLPSLTTNAIEMGEAFTKLLENELVEEWESNHLKPLYVISFPLEGLYTTDKKIENLSDVAGLKIGSVSGVLNHIPSLLGANGVSIRTPELYESLQRKVIDGNLFPMSNMDEYKLEEKINYAYKGTFGASNNVIAMNLNKFNSLSENVQKALIQAGEETSVKMAEAIEEKKLELIDKLKKNNIEVTEATQEQNKELMEVLAPLDDLWLEDVKKKGVENGEKLLESYRTAIQEITK